MNDRFPQYTTDYISGVMSLRDPQKTSLKILEEICDSIQLRKGMNLKAALGVVHAMYPICTDFEREFISLTFALATGVGKTRLMGAFIAYLYTQHDVRNFMVVAPNTTIYEKLKKDLSDFNSPKFVFRGLGCFTAQPQLITEDDYRTKQISTFESDVRLFVYNIDKFNKEDAKMRQDNENIGTSFYGYLAGLPDLVLIMDESHHYRAEKGAAALDDLHPLLGLELTATPLVTKGNKQTLFKNVVYEYPLSKAIEDGYTRTPFAITRSDIDFYNFGDEQMDKMMLMDGVAAHEKAKRKLEAYARTHEGVRLVKPFMLVVCKDTDHAQWVESYIKSDGFKNGEYKNKTIIVHSKQKGSETEANTRRLLDVERADNTVEIVIHVNMLKEGWDVNNLYTIVPLRTAASKILREQMVGRGLRLPYGERTGDEDIDAVMLTAHDKFDDIISEAQKGDSIFKAGNIIKAEDLEEEKTEYSQITLDLFGDDHNKDYEQSSIPKSPEVDAVFEKAKEIIQKEVSKAIQETPEHAVTPETEKNIVNTVKEKLSGDKDLGTTFRDNENPLEEWARRLTKEVHRKVQEKFIPIPQIKVTDEGVEEYVFLDFDLDVTLFDHRPIRNEILIQNLEDMSDRRRVRGDAIDFDGYNPKKVILDELCKKPEIDYQRCSDLLFKLITRLCSYYSGMYGQNGLKNIVMMYRKDIGNKIYTQMMQHFYCENGFIKEEVIGTRNYNMEHAYSFVERVSLYDSYIHDIRSVLFTGIKKGVFSTAKFDSKDGELTLARVMESDADVKNWLRPAPGEFRITYNHGRRYEPDFVVETEDRIYLVEVKGEDRLNDPDVIAKKKRAVQYCEVATRWGKANGYKEWQYLFIPAGQIRNNSSFSQLAEQYKEL